MKKFKFSIIVSVYNADPYIDEAVCSLLNQSIGFTDNIQVIFVNDASTDGSLEKIQFYKNKYPDNIFYINKTTNEGLALARLSGVAKAKGELVNFFDPDDTLSRETLENVYNFYKKNKDIADVFSIPMFMFGDLSGPHILNYKFAKGSRVIDLTEEPDMIQLSLASSFTKLDLIKYMDADPGLVTAEDARELIKLLSIKKKLGVIKEARYNYRRREGSSVTTAKMKKNWYDYYLDNFVLYSFEYFNKKGEKLPKFAQKTIFYDLTAKIKQANIPPTALSKQEILNYQRKLSQCISLFDNDIIYYEKLLQFEYKDFCLFTKNILEKGRCPSILETENDILINYGEGFNYSLRKLQIKINFLHINKNKIIIDFESYFPKWLKENNTIELIARLGNKIYKSINLDHHRAVFSASLQIGKWHSFRICIDKNELDIDRCTTNSILSFYLVLNKKELPLTRIKYGQFAPITEKIRKSFYVKDGILIKRHKLGISFSKTNTIKSIISELQFDIALIKKEHFRGIKWATRRIVAKVFKKFFKTNIWLFMEKSDKAGDNAEVLFKYISNNQNKNGITPIFVINKGKDYSRIKSIGKTVPYLSNQHKFLHLIAKHTISSYSHAEISSPFFKNTHFVCDLLQDNKIVFLQHGIIQNDVSQQLNRNLKNYSLFLTSSAREQKSIIQGNYGYKDGEIVLTGLPRYDNLIDCRKKIISIMPTFRRNLVGNINPKTSTYKKISNFEDTEYFIRYNSLISSEHFLKKLNDYGYKLQFILHPVFQIYSDLFISVDPNVSIVTNADYSKVFSESSLIITDYSSIAFDFAYLKKPVIYYQFDELQHYEKGYFTYTKDGFGEVTSTQKELENLIFSYLENNCIMKEEYIKRVNDFFAFHDRNNCLRVYNEIIKIDK